MQDRKKSSQRERSHQPRPRQRAANVTNRNASPEPSSDEACAGQSHTHPTAFADQPAAALDDTCLSSPETTLHGTVDASHDMYISGLTAAPAQRCVRVADNLRGVQCLAVATGKPAASRVHIQVPEIYCADSTLDQY